MQMTKCSPWTVHGCTHHNKSACLYHHNPLHEALPEIKRIVPILMHTQLVFHTAQMVCILMAVHTIHSWLLLRGGQMLELFEYGFLE